MRNRQVGPASAAQVLADLVPRTTYKPGWTFKLEEISRGQGCEGLTLLISATVPDTCTPGAETTFVHLMEVPAANYNERNWRRWILDQILKVEKHESLEWLRIDDAPGRTGLLPEITRSRRGPIRGHRRGADPRRGVRRGAALDRWPSTR
jgi:hypothetical protein